MNQSAAGESFGGERGGGHMQHSPPPPTHTHTPLQTAIVERYLCELQISKHVD